jgi:LysM repeat protein
MTDDVQSNHPRRRRTSARSHGEPGADERAAGHGDAIQPDTADNASDEDALAALARLQSLTAANATEAAQPPTSVAPRPVPRPPTRSPRPRPRVAGTSTRGHAVARIAAPAVFLVAVIALVSIVFQSGLLNGSSSPTSTPTPHATKAKSTTKTYVVKSGDTLSGIAAKFSTTASQILTLNPNLSSSTLVLGTKIRVPRSTP